MDYEPRDKQRKKKDKAKEKKDKFGTYSSKHIRAKEGIVPKPPPKKTN